MDSSLSRLEQLATTMVASLSQCLRSSDQDSSVSTFTSALQTELPSCSTRNQESVLQEDDVDVASDTSSDMSESDTSSDESQTSSRRSMSGMSRNAWRNYFQQLEKERKAQKVIEELLSKIDRKTLDTCDIEPYEEIAADLVRMMSSNDCARTHQLTDAIRLSSAKTCWCGCLHLTPLFRAIQTALYMALDAEQQACRERAELVSMYARARERAERLEAERNLSRAVARALTKAKGKQRKLSRDAWMRSFIKRNLGEAELHGPTIDKIISGKMEEPPPQDPNDRDPEAFRYVPLDGDGPEDELAFLEWLADTQAYKDWIETPFGAPDDKIPDVDFDTELRGSCFPREVSETAAHNLEMCQKLDMSTDGVADPVLVNAISAAAASKPDSATFVDQLLKAVKDQKPDIVLASITRARQRAMTTDNMALDEMAIALLIQTHMVLQRSASFQAGEYEAAAKTIAGFDPTKCVPSMKALFVDALNKFEDKCKDTAWYGVFKSFILGFYASYSLFGAAQDVFDWLMIHIKPAALVAILSTYTGTQASFIACLVAVLQLYDMFDPEIVSSVVTHLGELLWLVVQKGMTFLTGNPLGAVLQAPGDHISLISALGAGLIILLFGNLPQPLSRNVRNILTGATTVMGILKAFQLVYSLLTDWWTRRSVVSLLEQASAVTTQLNNPTVFSQATQLRKLKKHIDLLSEQVLTKLADPQFASHVTSLRALQTSLQTLAQRVSVLLAGSHERSVPQMWVFAGPPGIGKTHLVHYIASQLDKNTPSVFSCHVDHHDGYTGEPVCIWDEFDTDPKAEFIEKTIQMINNTPMLLNCDLAENKGKLFTSSVILATTNSDTMVLPNYPRAHAFYRRIQIVDVSSPVIDDFMAKNPGVQIPQGLFRGDCSHLQLKLRSYLAYTPQGNVLNSDKTVPSVTVSISKLVSKIKSEMPKAEAQCPDLGPAELQAPDDVIFQNIYIECEDPVMVRDYLQKYINHNNSFAVVCVASEMLAHVNCVGHRIICCRSPGPAAGGYCCKIVLDAPWGTFTDLNTNFGLHPKLPHVVNKNVMWRIFSSAVHLGLAKPQGMGVFHTYQVSNPVDLFTMMRREYGLACNLRWFGNTVKSFFTWDYAKFFEEVVKAGYPQERHAFAACTPVGTYFIFTCQGAQVFHSSQKLRVGKILPVLFQVHKGLGDILWDLGARIWRMIVSKFAHIISGAAVGHFIQQAAGRPQTAPAPRGSIRQYRGVALSDSEYETWQTYRATYDNTITAEEFIQARDAWRGNQTVTNARLRSLTDWLRTREVGLDASGAVLQSPDSDTHFCQRLTRESGEHGGWAIHIGSGRWIMNRHGYMEGLSILDTPVERIDHPLNANDIQVLRGPVIPKQAKLSDNPPVRTWDNRVVSFVQEHKCVVRDSEDTPWDVAGYIGMAPQGAVKGDCGRPYYDAFGNVSGIHSGFYTAASQLIISKTSPIPTVKQETWRGIPVVSSGMSLGPLPKGTKFGRSPAFPTIQTWEDAEPTPYGAGDPRPLPTQEKILAEQLESYTQPPPNLPVEIDQAANYVKKYFQDLLSFMPQPRTESLNEALLRLDLSTSCGPFVPGHKGLYVHIFNGIAEYDPSSSFGLHIHNMIARASAGQPLINAYKLALKDEVLPTEKARRKKRLLWGTDCAVTVLAAMVWGQTIDNLKALVAVSPCAVGCNPHSTYAGLIVKKFVGRTTLCLDYSKWDSTMNPKVIKLAVDMLCDFSEPGPFNDSLRATLHQPARGYFMDKYMTTLRGLPSGTPATSIVNSLCHCILFVAGLWRAQDEAGIARDVDPLINNPIVTYGDDCIYCFAPRNFPILQDFLNALRSFGLKPTSPDKSPNIRANVRETFLKREIVPTHDDKIVMRLDIYSILRQFCWIKGSSSGSHLEVKNPPTYRSTQIQEALIELALHGRETFEQWRYVFEATIEAEGLQVITDWQHLWDIHNSRYWVGDLTCNTVLDSLDEEPIFSMKRVKAELQSPDRQQQQAPPTTDSTGSTANAAADGSGLITGSYTATPATVGTAGGAMPDPAPLATMGAGVQSGVPTELYGLWVSSTRFTWNSQQPSGTRLGTLYLHPTLHPHLSLLSKMYAGWSGSLLIRVMVSAPGVVGGRLLCCILPPGIPPERVSNPTAYPCAIMDARLAAPLEMTLTDVRTTTYHTMDDMNSTSSFNIYVNAPLVNPYAGTDSHLSGVDVTIYVTPAPDFSFCLLMEPRSEQSSFAQLLPSTSAKLFCNRTGARAVTLTSFVSFCQVWNHFTTYGDTLGWGDGDPNGTLIVAANSNGDFNFGANAARMTVRVTTSTWGRPNRTGWDYAPTLPDWLPNGDLATTSDYFANNYWQNPIPLFTGIGYQTASDDNVDLHETTHMTCILFFGEANSNSPAASGTGPSDGKITGRPVSQRGSVALAGRAVGTSTSTKGAMIVQVGAISNNTGSADPKVPSGVPVAIATSGNNIATLGSTMTSTANRPVTLYSSQSIHTALTCRDEPVSFPSTSMLVFRFTSPSDTFEVGIRHDGYMVLGGSTAASVDLMQEYTIVYSGMATVTTPLVAPKPAHAASYANVFLPDECMLSRGGTPEIPVLEQMMANLPFASRTWPRRGMGNYLPRDDIEYDG
uniref:Genome polyprotein n=1 Tax=Duck calicivirus TaxID=2212758 RepID=A0A3G1RP96_9CALI|nr:MAG: polyprotein [Duck calicivirus]